MKKLYFFYIFFVIMTYAITINAANDFAGREWEYLEKTFIHNSTEKAQNALFIPKVLACSGITLSYATITSLILLMEHDNKKLRGCPR